jgi:hypothetical protein
LGAHARYERVAVALLIDSDISDDPRMAEEMCGAVDYAGIPLGNLSEAQIQSLLQKLVPTREIDDHHIERFLAWVGHRHPAALCEFIIRRLDRHAEMENDGGAKGGYAPVPHHRFGNAFHALQGTSHYREFLIQVRDRFVSQPHQQYWLRELFWSIGTLDSTTLEAIDELLHSGNDERLRAAIGLLAGAPPELALSRPSFAVHVIQECEHIDHELGDRAASALIGNAHGGAYQRAGGQPSPRYLTLRDRSAVLRDAFASDSVGNRLFARLYDSAVAALDRERVDDEQMDFH